MRQRKEIQEVLRRHRKNLIGAAIIVFWLLMMGLLARREIAPLLFGPKFSAQYPASPTDSWMRILSPSGQPLGFINTQTAPETRDGFPGTRISLMAIMRMQFLGQPMPLHLTGAAWIARTGDTADFDFSVKSDEHGAQFEGSLENGLLEATLYTAGEAYPFAFPVDREITIGGIAGTAALQLASLEPGDEAVIEAFDPMTLTMGTARVKCLGYETIGEGEDAQRARVVTVTMQDIESKAWIDEHGETLRAETPLGLVLEKTTSQKAMEAVAGEAPQDLIEAVAIRPSGERPLRGAKRMVIRVAGLSELTSLPEDANQQVLDDGRVVIEPVSAGETAEPPEGLAEYLAPHPFVQSDHPEIVQTAAGIVEGSETTWDMAVRINAWVYEHIEKQGVLSVPSAIEVLRTKTGDCNEHTVLFAALARSVGVPTRIALGVVWSEDLEGFYYHAWPEVYAGEWVWMDPTFGQEVADATHVKLVTGDIERWPRLMSFLGKLEIDVVEVE